MHYIYYTCHDLYNATTATEENYTLLKVIYWIITKLALVMKFCQREDLHYILELFVDIIQAFSLVEFVISIDILQNNTSIRWFVCSSLRFSYALRCNDTLTIRLCLWLVCEELYSSYGVEQNTKK